MDLRAAHGSAKEEARVEVQRVQTEARKEVAELQAHLWLKVSPPLPLLKPVYLSLNSFFIRYCVCTSLQRWWKLIIASVR